MRKSQAALAAALAENALQCGRIYKDAEMGKQDARAHDVFFRLQCGRIYKDAEIPDEILEGETVSCPSMWPHL